MTTRPLEIVGGGLAGLSLGLALRRAGVPVTLFDAGNYPRHRVCGEFITGLDARTIARLRLEPFFADVRKHRDISWFIPGRPPRSQRLPKPALGISRHRLDAQLAVAFVAAGGELCCSTRIESDEAREGRIFASGRRRGDSEWLGLKVHIRNLALASDLEIHLGNRMYVGLCGVEDNRVNVCGLFARRALSARGPKLLWQYLRAAGLDVLADRLEGADVDGASMCAVAAVNFDVHEPPPGKIVLGDAYALTPPFTGNGMAMAFQSAALALDPLLGYARGAASWPAACEAVRAALRRRFQLRLAAARLLHPFLLRPKRQQLLATLHRARLLPLRPLYAAVH